MAGRRGECTNYQICLNEVGLLFVLVSAHRSFVSLHSGALLNEQKGSKVPSILMWAATCVHFNQLSGNKSRKGLSLQFTFSYILFIWLASLFEYLNAILWYTVHLLKGALHSFWEDINIYNINRVKIQTRKYSFFYNWIKKVPEHCLKRERWRGPPNINKVKQYYMVLFVKVSVFIYFV